MTDFVWNPRCVSPTLLDVLQEKRKLGNPNLTPQPAFDDAAFRLEPAVFRFGRGGLPVNVNLNILSATPRNTGIFR